MSVGATLCLAITVLFAPTGCSDRNRPEQQPSVTGEALFLRHCSGCHPQGRNLLYTQKDLRRLTLTANGITTPQAVVKVMRNPGQGMPRFNETIIPAPQALSIAHYLLEKFR